MRLVSFGRVGLEGSSFSRPKPLLLLAYLTLEGPQERRKLARLLWSDAGGKGLGSLSVALAQFKKDGAAEVFPDTPGLDPLHSQVECDALSFLAAVEERDWERAVSLYRGPFLHDLGRPMDALDVSGELYDWVLERREAFAQRAQAAMLERAEMLSGEGRAREAQGLAERAYAMPEAPDMEPALLSRVQRLAKVGSDLSRRAGSAAFASLGDLPPAAGRVLAALSLQERPNLTIVKGALALPMGELASAREALVIGGLIDADNRVLAEGTAKGWLAAHPGERIPLLLALARATPPEEAYHLYRRVHEGTQGFGGAGDFLRARAAYVAQARALVNRLAFAEAAALLQTLRAVERVIEADPDPGGRFLEAYALERLGRFKEALDRLEALPNPPRDPDAEALRSVLLWRRGSPDEAREIAERVLLEGEVGRLWAKATANSTLGYLAGSAGHFLAAAGHFKKAAALFQAAGARDRWVGSLNNYAVELDKLAREAEGNATAPDALEAARADAERAYRQALEALGEGDDNPTLRARVLLNLGVLWERRGDWGKAEALYTQALGFAEAAGASEVSTRLHLGLGLTGARQHRPHEARDAFRRAMDLAAKTGEFFTQGVAMAHLADLDDDPDALEVALALMEQSGHHDGLRASLVSYEDVLVRLIGKAYAANNAEGARRLQGRLAALQRRYGQEDGPLPARARPSSPRQN